MVDDLLMRIKYRVCKFLTYPLNKIRFKKFGNHSSILSPDILIGTKYICVGDHVGILQHARIEAISSYEGKRYNPEILIGSNCGIGRMIHIEASMRVVIGHDVLMSENIYISDTSHGFMEIGVNTAVQDLKIEPVEIGDYCFIGRNVCILPGVKLGKQCIVGANAVVTAGDYPDYSVIVGVPGKIIKNLTLSEE